MLLPLEGTQYAELALQRNPCGLVKTPKRGICFMLCAQNEDPAIAITIKDLHEYFEGKIDYQIVLIHNESSVETQESASRVLRPHTDISITYPIRVSKAGLENYVTPCNSAHSLVWFYQFSLQQCKKYSHVFKWDLDFSMTAPLAKQLIDLFSPAAPCDPAETYSIAVLCGDGMFARNFYLISRNTGFYYRKFFLWEEAHADRLTQRIALPQNAHIVHNLDLHGTKPHLCLPPWWEVAVNDVKGMQHAQKAKKEFTDLSAKLSANAQLFCRMRDPACNELMGSLDHKIEFIEDLSDFASETLIFQIGMHKTATCAINAAFNALHIPSMHVGPGPLQSVFEECVDQGKPYKHFKAFTDFLWIHDEKAYSVAEARVKNLRKIYPNAKFLLNVRNVDEWLHSHLANTIRHRVRTYTISDLRAIKTRWFRWHAFVLREFQEEPERLLVFDIERDDPMRLARFCIGPRACPQKTEEFWQKVYATPQHLKKALPKSSWWQT